MEIPKIDNPTLYILIGVPGSGKSTYAEELFQKSERGIALVSSDQIRKSLYGNENCQDNPKKVFAIAHQATIDQLNKGYDVIFDATNIYTKDRMDLILKVCFEVKKPVRFVAVYFDTPISECIKRQDLRERKVPTKVIEKMGRQIDKPTFQEGFDIIKTI
jgi:predicted kinase